MKKPKVWDIAVLTGIVLIIVMLVMTQKRDGSAHAVCVILAGSGHIRSAHNSL